MLPQTHSMKITVKTVKARNIDYYGLAWDLWEKVCDLRGITEHFDHTFTRQYIRNVEKVYEAVKELTDTSRCLVDPDYYFMEAYNDMTRQQKQILREMLLPYWFPGYVG